MHDIFCGKSVDCWLNKVNIDNLISIWNDLKFSMIHWKIIGF